MVDVLVFSSISRLPHCPPPSLFTRLANVDGGGGGSGRKSHFSPQPPLSRQKVNFLRSPGDLCRFLALLCTSSRLSRVMEPPLTDLRPSLLGGWLGFQTGNGLPNLGPDSITKILTKQ